MAVLPIAAVALAAVGTAVSVSAAQSQAAAQSSAAGTNAAIAGQNAQIAVQQAGSDSIIQQRQAFQSISAMRAAYGASGVTSSGSPIDALSASSTAAELDRQTILYKGQMKALGYNEQEGIDTAGASNALTQGNDRASAALISGLSTVATRGYGLLGSNSGGATSSGGGFDSGYAAGNYGVVPGGSS